MGGNQAPAPDTEQDGLAQGEDDDAPERPLGDAIEEGGAGQQPDADRAADRQLHDPIGGALGRSEGAQPALVAAAHSGRWNCAPWAIDDEGNSTTSWSTPWRLQRGALLDLRDGHNTSRLQLECDGT